MKKIIFILISFYVGIINVYGDTFNDIDMKIYIDENGKAKVEEIWNVDISSGTELYKSYYNMKNSSINNLKVIESNNEYKNVKNWKSLTTIEDKENKSGIVTVNGGYELCFGIGSYGNKIYTISYDIDEFIDTYSDSQAIYFTLLGQYNMTRKHVSILIDSVYDFKYKGKLYGTNGNLKLIDGNIYIEASNLENNDYIMLFNKIKENTYNTNSNMYISYKEIKNEIYGNEYGFIWYLWSNFKTIFIGTFAILLILFVILKIIKSVNNFENKKCLDKVIKIKNLPDINHDVKYFKDIPCNNNFNAIFLLCLEYGIIDDCSLIISSYFLKWIALKDVEVIKEDDKIKLDFKKFKNDSFIDNYIYKIIKQSFKKENILDFKDFQNWLPFNIRQLNNVIAICLNDGGLFLEKNKVLIDMKKETNKELYKVVDKGKYGYINVIYKGDYKATEMVKIEIEHILGLKKYLKDFTKMNKREVKDVHLWRDYLIFARLLNITDDIKNELEINLPELSSYYDELIFSSDFKLPYMNLNNVLRDNYVSGGGGGDLNTPSIGSQSGGISSGSGAGYNSKGFGGISGKR